MARFTMLIGAVLQQARRVTDRLQLGFDCGELHIDNPTVLRCDSGEAVQLSDLIGSRISESIITHSEWLMVFDGRIYLSVSLRDEDFISSAAAVYRPKAQAAEPVVVDQLFLSQLAAGTI
jgi:hypothetical protein